MKRLFWSLVLVLVLGTVAQAAIIHAGPSGTGNGTSWNDIANFNTLSLVRGNTYFLQDGTYAGRDFGTALSGTTLITIKKAVPTGTTGCVAPNCHGSETGWSDAYGDGQATFSSLSFLTSYWVFDGAKRNESNWQQTSAYGFFISALGEVYLAAHVRDITMRYFDIGGTNSEAQAGIRQTQQDGLPWRTNLTYSRCHIHNLGIALFSREASFVTMDNCWIGPMYAKEAIGHQYGSNWTIANNYFIDTASGQGQGQLTAVIGLFNYFGGGTQLPSDTLVENGRIYGNVFGRSTGAGTQAISDALVTVISTGWVFYNNSIYNPSDSGPEGYINIHKNGAAGTNNIMRNNLFYNVTSPSGSIESQDKSWVNTSHSLAGTVYVGNENPFVDVANLNFRLKTTFSGVSPVNVGTNLGAPFNVDLDGNTRGTDGAWDIGAFERNGGAPSPPAAPTNLRLIAGVLMPFLAPFILIIGGAVGVVGVVLWFAQRQVHDVGMDTLGGGEIRRPLSSPPSQPHAAGHRAGWREVDAEGGAETAGKALATADRGETVRSQ